jgi:hypothetical protein
MTCTKFLLKASYGGLIYGRPIELSMVSKQAGVYCKSAEIVIKNYSK